jgi:hypothetical protein
LPVTHRRATRTTNLLERLFVEERRRLKIVPNGFGEKPVWPAPGSEDTELGVLMELEVGHGETEVYARVQA